MSEFCALPIFKCDHMYSRWLIDVTMISVMVKAQLSYRADSEEKLVGKLCGLQENRPWILGQVV